MPPARRRRLSVCAPHRWIATAARGTAHACAADERHGPFHYESNFVEVLQPNPPFPAPCNDTLGRLKADSGDPQDFFVVGPVEVHGEELWMALGICKFRIDGEIEIGTVGSEEFFQLEAVEAHEPVGLIEPVFPPQGWLLERGQAGILATDGDEGGVIHSFQMVRTVKLPGEVQDFIVSFRSCTDNELGALPCGCKEGGGTDRSSLVLVPEDGIPDGFHRAENPGIAFVGGQVPETPLGGKLNVDTQAVRQQSRLSHEGTAGSRDAFQVDVTAEAVIQAECPGDANKAFHCVVGAFQDTGTQEQSFDVIALIELNGEIDEFPRGEGCAGNVVACAVGAVGTVENAEIREKHFQQGDASPVFGERMADAAGYSRAESLSGRLTGASAGGTRDVVSCSSGQDFKLLKEIHVTPRTTTEDRPRMGCRPSGPRSPYRGVQTGLFETAGGEAEPFCNGVWPDSASMLAQLTLWEIIGKGLARWWLEIVECPSVGVSEGRWCRKPGVGRNG